MTQMEMLLPAERASRVQKLAPVTGLAGSRRKMRGLKACCRGVSACSFAE